MRQNPFDEIAQLVVSNLNAAVIAIALNVGKEQYSSPPGFPNNEKRREKADKRVRSIPLFERIQRGEDIDNKDVMLALRDLLEKEGGTDKYSLKFQVCRELVIQVLADGNLRNQLSLESQTLYEKVKDSALDEIYLFVFRMGPGKCLELIEALRNKLGELNALIQPGTGTTSSSPLLGKSGE
jgi:hypothetical protein